MYNILHPETFPIEIFPIADIEADAISPNLILPATNTPITANKYRD